MSDVQQHDGHTIDVGFVHTLDDDGDCLPTCPHPDHETQGGQ